MATSTISNVTLGIPYTTASQTLNGLSVSLSKWGRVATLTITNGTLTNAVGNGSSIGTINEDYRPRASVITRNAASVDDADAERWTLESSGALKPGTNKSAGAMVRLSMTYITSK